MKKALFLMTMALLSSNALAQTKEFVVDDDKNTAMMISIYNNNIAFVKDTRKVDLKEGDNLVAFKGVSRELKPETVRIGGQDINITEQNYDYKLVNQQNLLQEYIGKEVKTALYNEQTGQTTFDKAKVIDGNYGMPVLEFSYGIETNFPGRVIFENIPSTLRTKPTFIANIETKKPAQRDLELAYLTGGLTWSAEYTADVDSNTNTMDLNSWITLTNNSGIDYKNATVNVIAGSVNLVSYYNTMMHDAVAPMYNERAMTKSANFAGAVAMPEQEALGDYHMYTLPVKTTIKDNQSKQVGLLSKSAVKFEKEYRLKSPLYVDFNGRETEFVKANPQVIIKITNSALNNLGLPLPSGVVRFYEKDSKGNSQFLGESRIPQVAVSEKADLQLGNSFDIYATGKLINANKLSDDIYEAEVDLMFTNTSDKDVNFAFLQAFNYKWEILSETIKSSQKNASTAEWNFKLPKRDKASLKFKFRITYK